MSKPKNIYLAKLRPTDDFDQLITMFQSSFQACQIDTLILAADDPANYDVVNRITATTRSFLRLIDAARKHHVRVLVDFNLAGLENHTPDTFTTIIKRWHACGVDGICLQNLSNAQPTPQQLIQQCRSIFGQDSLVIAGSQLTPPDCFEYLDPTLLDYIYLPQTIRTTHDATTILHREEAFKQAHRPSLLYFAPTLQPTTHPHLASAIGCYCLCLNQTAMITVPLGQELADFYPTLLRFRAHSQAVKNGAYRHFKQNNRSLHTYERRLDDEHKILVVCSFSRFRQTVYLPYRTPPERLYYSNYPDETSRHSWEFLLKPYEARIFVWGE